MEPSVKVKDVPETTEIHGPEATKVTGPDTTSTPGKSLIDNNELLSALPNFREALSKINPETKRKLFQLKPFKFLTNLENPNTYASNQSSSVSTAPGVSLRDPYADLEALLIQKTNVNSKEKRCKSQIFSCTKYKACSKYCHKNRACC